MTNSTYLTGFVPGLAGVVAAQTRLSSVNGLKGELIIAGFPLEEIASQATFEEMAYLLWNDTLPTPVELDKFRQALAAERVLPITTTEILQAAAQHRLPAIGPFNKPLHRLPPQIARRIISATAFLRSQGQDLPVWRQPAHGRSTPES